MAKIIHRSVPENTIWSSPLTSILVITANGFISRYVFDSHLINSFNYFKESNFDHFLRYPIWTILLPIRSIWSTAKKRILNLITVWNRYCIRWEKRLWDAKDGFELEPIFVTIVMVTKFRTPTNKHSLRLRSVLNFLIVSIFVILLTHSRTRTLNYW